nr:reverse transcriptase domain-containing protein [Tanacetum cinerariifolium]
MTSLTNSNLELKNMFGQFMKMNTASSSSSETLPGNTITNPKEYLKGITNRSGTAYQGSMIPTTSSSLPPIVERETEVTKDTMPHTNNRSTKDVQPPVVQTETPIQNSQPVVAPIIEPVVAPISLPELSPTCMTQELADRLISRPVGVAEDVFVKLVTFHFPVDFVVVEFNADSRVPLILGRSFFKTERDLVDVFEGELALHVGKAAITFNLDQTLRYSANYNDMTANQIDVIDMACEEYSKELRNEIINFRQRPDESLFEAWERFKLSIDRSLKAEMAEINKNLIKVLQINQQVKAVAHNCETYGGPHSYNDCPTTVGQTQSVYAARAYNPGGNSYQPQGKRCHSQNMHTNMTSLTNFNLELKNMFGQFIKMNTASSSSSKTLLSNTVTNPKEDLKGITIRSGNAYQGSTIPTTSSLPQVVERETEVTKDMVPPTNNESTKDVQPPVVQIETPIPNSELVVAPVSAPKPNKKPSIPYLSRLHDQKLHDKANNQKEKIFKIFKDFDFNISFADALILMPKFGPTIKSLLNNKEKLYELARTLLNEHCSAVLLKKLPKKLGDPGKFLILCDFPRMDECLALADLGASINLMPLSVWNKLSLPELTPTLMTLKLADRISFLKTGRVLIDVYAGELTLRVNNEAVTFNLDQNSRYSANDNDMMVNRIDVIDMACEEYSQEVLGFSDVNASGNPTPYYDPIVSTSSPTLTPFGDSDFLLEEVDAFLALEEDPTSPKVDHSYYDMKGDIHLLKAFLNDDPSLTPPTQRIYLPQIRKELKICEAKNDKSSIDEPPEVELKDLPPHLEYTFLEGDDKFLS